MVHPSCLANNAVALVADTSTLINLNGAGLWDSILDGLPNRLLVVEQVRMEIERGRSLGRNDGHMLDRLIESDRATVVSLGNQAFERYRGLVEGSAKNTLDDGEAATIAYAVDQGVVPVIDEKKANRICEERFPRLPRAATVDIFSHPAVRDALGSKGLEGAVLSALKNARMRVLPRHEKWILDLLGPERASSCNSLRRYLRETT